MSDTSYVEPAAPPTRRLVSVLACWRVAVADGLSFVIRCTVGLAYLRRYAGLFGLARVKGRPDIVNEGEITIGPRVIVINKYLPCEIHCAKGARIAIGRNVQINYGVLIAARKNVTIGDNVLVGNLSVISDVNFPKLPEALAPEDDPPLPIEIGDDVWLAARVTVLPGARIGRGSVIGAGSVVKGTIPPGVIAMGNPARPLLRIGESRAAGRHPGRSEAGDLGPVRFARSEMDTGSGFGFAAPGMTACFEEQQMGRAKRPEIVNRGELSLGADVCLSATPVVTHLLVGPGARLAIGDRVAIGHGSSLHAHLSIEIGDDVLIGPFAVIMDTDHHHSANQAGVAARAPIVIEEGARIGAHATVLRGARIGAGAWIEAGSVVVGHVPPSARVAGNPAR